MIIFSGVVCLTTMLVCAVVAYPTHNPDDDAEVVVVPLEHQAKPESGEQPEVDINIDTVPDFHNFDGVIDTNYQPGFFSFSPAQTFNWNFGFFDRFQEMLRQLREQAASAWSSRPIVKEVVGETPVPDDSKSTSVVKFINGHRVVINDTYYTKKTSFGESIYKIRTVDVQPTDDEFDETTAGYPINDKKTSPSFEIESVDDSRENFDLDQRPRDTENDDSSEELETIGSRVNEISKNVDDVEVTHLEGE